MAASGRHKMQQRRKRYMKGFIMWVSIGRPWAGTRCAKAMQDAGCEALLLWKQGMNHPNFVLTFVSIGLFRFYIAHIIV